MIFSWVQQTSLTAAAHTHYAILTEGVMTMVLGGAGAHGSWPSGLAAWPSWHLALIKSVMLRRRWLVPLMVRRGFISLKKTSAPDRLGGLLMSPAAALLLPVFVLTTGGVVVHFTIVPASTAAPPTRMAESASVRWNIIRREFWGYKRQLQP